MKSLKTLYLCLLSLLPFASPALSDNIKWGQWEKWGDRGDGTYLNPILPSDYSDIDCIRVGDDYYAISSTFQFSPGMTLLRSKDLVNWEICTNIVTDLTRIGPELDWTRMNRYGRGIWAGTLRHHEGRFYLFFGTPDEGFFMTSSADAQGPWEPLTCLLPEAGWDDCTALWDDDGKAYFVGTNFADGYKTWLFDMTPDGKSIDRDSARLLNEGNRREASKLIKVGAKYYLVFSEHKGRGRYVLAKRADRITGPYDEERQLTYPCREANEPNQGGIVEGKDGSWYFLTHHGTGDWSGRIVSLLPVTWIDGWPVIGTITGRDSIGSMTWSGKMPSDDGRDLKIARSDDFNDSELAPQWQWNYQPRTDKYSLTERKGWLRLKAFPPLKPNTLKQAGNTLTQRCFRTDTNTVVVKMDISRMADGQRSGLCHFSITNGGIGIVADGDRRYIEYRENDSTLRGEPVNSRTVWFKTTWGLDGIAKFYYSFNGKDYKPFGKPYRMTWGHYRGDCIGIYTFNDKSTAGHVDIDYLHYD
ncbi:MAG: glycoside hydrolase 43 family protein [Duncaniella sp.]|nr:glycoside hydrolase 43 family protein [Duncaniella sp.]